MTDRVPGRVGNGAGGEAGIGKTTASVNPAVARTATGRKTLLAEEDAA